MWTNRRIIEAIEECDRSPMPFGCESYVDNRPTRKTRFRSAVTNAFRL